MKRSDMLAILDHTINKHLEDVEDYEGDAIMFDRILKDLEAAGMIAREDSPIWTAEDSKLSV